MLINKKTEKTLHFFSFFINRIVNYKQKLYNLYVIINKKGGKL